MGWPHNEHCVRAVVTEQPIYTRGRIELVSQERRRGVSQFRRFVAHTPTPKTEGSLGIANGVTHRDLRDDAPALAGLVNTGFESRPHSQNPTKQSVLLRLNHKKTTRDISNRLIALAATQSLYQEDEDHSAAFAGAESEAPEALSELGALIAKTRCKPADIINETCRRISEDRCYCQIGHWLGA